MENMDKNIVNDENKNNDLSNGSTEIKKAVLPDIKSLTRKELRELREAGLDPMMTPGMTYQKIMEMVDFILDHKYPEYNFENIEHEELVKFAVNTHLKTYGRAEEIKN